MPLTPEQIADGWIEHDGSGCPVEPFSKPGVIIRGFFGTHPCQFPGGEDEAAAFEWQHNPRTPAADIIAYKPENRHA